MHLTRLSKPASFDITLQVLASEPSSTKTTSRSCPSVLETVSISLCNCSSESASLKTGMMIEMVGKSRLSQCFVAFDRQSDGNRNGNRKLLFSIISEIDFSSFIWVRQMFSNRRKGVQNSGIIKTVFTREYRCGYDGQSTKTTRMLEQFP